MLRYIFLLCLICSFNIFADIFVSSPKIKVNSQDQRIIEFRIENEEIDDGDIVLKEYKNNDPIDQTYIAYTLINDFGDYQTFSIILNDEYIENYFSFKIVIKENFSKDIFIFLPSKIRTSISNSRIYKPEVTQLDLKTDGIIEKDFDKIELPLKKFDVLKASEITTVWSMAKKIKGQNKDISIYQVMWSIYLGNREAFINDNINLIRKDIDILIPSLTNIKDISYQVAKDSIIDMNKSFASSIESASKSLLVLTAPKVPNEAIQIKENKTNNKSTEQITFDEFTDPGVFIEQNSKQISISVEDKVLDDFVEEIKQTSEEKNKKFEMFDLIFISLISLVSGILLALIFIQIRNIRVSKEIEYDFEEARDDDSLLSTLPSGLSIKNDIDQQQYDLAVMYFEMNDKKNAEVILKNLIATTDNLIIKQSSISLLDKVKAL